MKKLILVAGFPFIINSLTAQSITDGLLLYYKLDGTANDYSGTGNNGQTNGVLAVNDEDGMANSAYFFDGVDDFIDFPNNSALKPQLPVTISYKVKFEHVNQVGSQMFTTDFEQNNYHGVWANLSADGQGRVGIHYGGGLGGNGTNNRQSKLSDDMVVSQKWYRLTFIVNGPSDMEIYIDCNNAGGSYSGTGPSAMAYSNVAGSIGRVDAHSGLPAYYFNGTIDDFAYWNRALSEAEVDLLCSDVLGVEDVQTSMIPNFITYPNPFRSSFSFELGSPNVGNSVYEIFDLTGASVKTGSCSVGKTIVLGEELANGLYLLKVLDANTNECIVVTRIVKSR